VVVNKVDRADARSDEVHTEVFDLFAALGADDHQLDFPMLYASGRQGWADTTLEGPRKDLSALFDLVISHVPAPTVDPAAPFAMVASILEYDNFLGRVLTGRIEQGHARLNMPLKVFRADGSVLETGRLTKLLSFRGLDRVPVEEAQAGDIVAIAGLTEATVPDTIGGPDLAAPLPAIPVDPPTLAMTFRINDGPLAGREGKKVTSRQIRDRLFREADGNVAIKVTDSNETEAFEVAGRGELQLGVLIEQMRREGFELCIGRPRVLTRSNPETGAREEPMEEVLVDVDEPYAGVVVEKLSRRKGELRDMRPTGGAKLRLTFAIPSRGLIGYHGEFLTDTRGTGIMNRMFAGYGAWKGPIEGRRNGSLISTENGEAVHYALFYIQERGTLFVNPGEKVYVGMILGENARGADLEVNPIKEKKLTNIRAAGKDDAMLLVPPRRMSLEQAIAYIEDDELVEVTPSAVRLRKRFLDSHERKRSERRSQDAAA
jgi:GTP-binding protein